MELQVATVADATPGVEEGGRLPSTAASTSALRLPAAAAQTVG